MELTDLDQVVDSHSGCKKLYRFMSQDIKAIHIFGSQGSQGCVKFTQSRLCSLHGVATFLMPQLLSIIDTLAQSWDNRRRCTASIACIPWQEAAPVTQLWDSHRCKVPEIRRQWNQAWKLVVGLAPQNGKAVRTSIFWVGDHFLLEGWPLKYSMYHLVI